jgi:predicted esterase
MDKRLSSFRVIGPVVVGLFVAACSTGSDTPSNGSGSAGATGNAGTGADSSGGRGGGGAGSTGEGGQAGGGAGGGAGRAGTSGGAGVAGTTGIGGRGGGSGASGAAGSAGGAGQVGSGGAGGTGTTTAPMPSAGCSTTATQALNQWVQSTVTSSNTSRAYSVRLPSSYDPSRAYPVIVLLHGCGSGTNNVPMENATGTNAILVRGTGSASGTCWDTSATGPDVAFVDAMIADVKARFCADEGRFFVVGYSSGSWLVNQLTCIRANVLRGGATVTGGEAASAKCGGPVARMFVHDMDDTDNVISGSEKARDRQLTQNGCDKSLAPVPQDPSPCVRYPGCPAAYPVVWCPTSGQKHNRQDSWVPAAFWNFFKAL